MNWRLVGTIAIVVVGLLMFLFFIGAGVVTDNDRDPVPPEPTGLTPEDCEILACTSVPPTSG